MKQKKKFLYYLLIGFLIRIFLMPLFTHWDLPALYEMVRYIAYEGIKNVYAVVYNYNKWAAVYPPLTFFSLAGYLFVLKPLMPLFSSGAPFDLNSIFYPGWVTSDHAFRYLFLLKLPFLFFDLGLAYLLSLFFKKEEEKLATFKFWVFCPVALYVSFIFGHFDIVPTFFVVLSLWFLKKKRISYAFLLLGIAAAFKSYPLFLLLPLVLITSKNIWQGMRNFIFGAGPFLVTILPFLKNMSFRDPVLYSNTSEYFFKNQIMVGEGDSLIPFFICYGMILIYFFLKRGKEDIFEKSLLAATLVLISFFSFVYFHPQWFLWLMPFLGLYLVRAKRLSFIYWLIIVLYIPYLFHFSSSTSWYLFDVVNIDFFHYLKTPKEFIFQFYNADNFLHVCRSFLTAALLVFGVYIFRLRSTDESI